MILTDSDIVDRILTGDLIVDPHEPDQVQPASMDLRLGRDLLALSGHAGVIDPAVDQSSRFYRQHLDDGSWFDLYPGMFVLASTHELLQLPDDLAARWEGKSSLGRLGLLTHVTAGFIDPGFRGHITLELANVTSHPIRLWPGMRIGQLCLYTLAGIPFHPYGSTSAGSHYQGQVGPTASRGHERFTSFHHDREPHAAELVDFDGQPA
jgi:dCTP deaminase